MVHRQETRTQTRFVEVNFQVFLLQIDMNVSMFYFFCIFGVTAVFPYVFLEILRGKLARGWQKNEPFLPPLCVWPMCFYEQAQILEVNTLNNIVTMVQVKKKKS